MIRSFRRLITRLWQLPTFKDEEQARRAALLNSLLWLTLLGTWLFVLSVTSLGDSSANPAHAILLGFILTIAVTPLFVLLRAGKINLASMLLVAVMLALITVRAYNQGGIRYPFTIAYMLVIVTAGLLLGGRSVVLTTLISVLAAVALTTAERRGMLPLEYTPSPIHTAGTYVVAFTFMGLYLFLANKYIQEAFRRARDNEQRLMDSVRELVRVRSGLEQRVTERTRDLERRTTQLQAAADVGNAVIVLRELDELLPKVCYLISERFGYYHVGIFLLDQAQEYAVLQATNSPGGERMLARHHHLAVGSHSLVGYVTANRKPRVVMDTGSSAAPSGDSFHLQNPDLPETRSEMALPLLVGDKLLGALDVQSTQPSAFGSEDIAMLQLVADQVAVAIDNARLFAENQSSLDTARRAYGELSQAAWGKIMAERSELGFTCSKKDVVTPSEGDWTRGMKEASQALQSVQSEDGSLAVPIHFHELVRGVVRLRKPDDRTWTPDEINFVETLTGQLYMALENARLYQETQRRAERERLAGEITARLRQSNDPQVILQTAVQGLRQALQVRSAQVLVSQSTPTRPTTKLDGEEN